MDYRPARRPGPLESFALIEEIFPRELVRIVEYYRYVPAAPNSQGLPGVDIHEEVRRRFGSDRICKAADPSILLAAVGRRCMPVRHRGEVRERRVVIPASVHHGQLAILVEAFEPNHPAIETEVVVDRPKLLLAGRRSSAEAGSRRRHHMEPAYSGRRCRPKVPAQPVSFHSIRLRRRARRPHVRTHPVGGLRPRSC